MLSSLLVKRSPSPLLPYKKDNGNEQHQQQLFTNTYSFEQDSSFISSSNNIHNHNHNHNHNKQYRPIQNQSLTRANDFHHNRQYPNKLQIFQPHGTSNKQDEKQNITTRTYEYEFQHQQQQRRRSFSETNNEKYRNHLNLHRDYLDCFSDLTNEYEKLGQQKKSLNNQKTRTITYETQEQNESFQDIQHHQQSRSTHRNEDRNTYQRSHSESLLHKQLKPLVRNNLTISDENLKSLNSSLKYQQRLLKPIHIHSSTNSIAGETYIKYVRTERLPVEIVLPKSQIVKTSEEHSSNIAHDIRRTNNKVATNIHQQLQKRTIEGENELHIFEKPITSERTHPVEFTVPKSMETSSMEHLSRTISKNRRGDRFHTIDIGSTLFNKDTFSRKQDCSNLFEPIQSNSSHPKPLEYRLPTSTYSTHHSSTIVKQNRISKSTLVLNNIQTKLKGEHDLRFIDQPIQSDSMISVELMVPKALTTLPQHTTTVITEKQPSRRVLEITGSGKKQTSEHQTKYFHDGIRIEEQIEVKLPKRQLEQVEHSATIVKHNHGKGPIIEIDTTQKQIEGKHELKIIQQSVEARPDTMQLLIEKPKLSPEHSTTIIKGQHGKSQIITIDQIQPIPGQYETKYYDRSIESYGEMEVLLPKRQISNSSQEGKHQITYIKQNRPKYEPVDLIIERPIILPSVSKLIADIPASTQITSIKSTDILSKDDNSLKLDIELNNQQYDEMQFFLEKSYVRDSSTTSITTNQSDTKLKSTQENTHVYKESKEFYKHNSSVQSESVLERQVKPSPFIQQPIIDSSTSLTMELNRDQQTKPFELIIPRLDVESSTSTIFAQVSPMIASLQSKLDIPSDLERSSSNIFIEQKKSFDNEIELIMPKPKHIETSTSTVIAPVQGKLETQDVRPNEIELEQASSIYYFDQTTEYVLPEPVEIRMKQPIVRDSSTTLLANIKPTLDTRPIQIQTNSSQPFELSSSSVSLETQFQKSQPTEIELALPCPQIQESTFVVLANIHPTLDTSHKLLIIPPPLYGSIESSNQVILEQDNFETTPIELNLHHQPSTQLFSSKIDKNKIENDDIYILGADNQQEQQYGSSTVHADLNKPVEFVFNVDGGNMSTVSQQYRQDYNTRMLTSAMNGADKSLSFNTENVSRQFKPIEFIVSGGLGGYNNTVEQHTTGADGSYTTTTTTTKRIITSSDAGGYNETTNRSVIRGIRPYDQVDLVLQPDSSISSSSKVLTTTVGLDSNHAPYFALSLHDQTAKEGDSVLFEVVVSAQPAAEIVWDKDGTLIGDDSAFRIDYYGDGRATLYIPEAFFDDQGYYTCTATNQLGTCRTTSRLTVDSTGESTEPKRRQITDSSVVYYEQGPKRTSESYHIYSQPSRTITQVTEETNIYQIPPQQQQQQQQHNEINYSIHGTQSKFQPVSFLVSATQENEHQRHSSGLVATMAKQPGPTLTHYQQYGSYEPERMQTESATSSIRYAYSHEQPTSTSYVATRPNFTKPLEPIDALEGGTIQITVHLTSVGPHHSRPQIQWYHHGLQIIPDDKHYRIIEGYDTSTLEIIHITRADTGQVWCVATTSSGSATTTCNITVEENPVRTYHQLMPSYQVVPHETVYKSQATHLSHAQIPIHHQQPEQRVPSNFYTTQTISQQQVSPHPYTPVTSQTTHTYVTQASSLQTQQVPSQYATTQSFVPQAPPLLSNLNIRPNYSDQQVKITDNGLQDQPLYLGSDTVFECHFTGNPEKVQWFHNDVEIDYNPQQLNNRVYHITNPTNGTSRLIIRTTTNEDIGTYTVKIAGPNGIEVSSAKLIQAAQFENMQRKKTELTQRKALVQELEEKQIKRMRPSKQLGPRGSLASYGTSDDDVFYEPTQRTAAPHRQPTAPILSRPLKDSTVKEGQPILLTCQVQGFPKSELFWFKNNVPLPLSARHKIAYDAGSGTITLRVNDSRPEDSGTYTVIAKNPQGYVQTSAYIDVGETPAIDETSYVQPDAFKYIEKQPVGPRPFKGRRESDTSNLQQKPAKILKTPMNTSILEGGTVQFSCQVEGNPKPKVAWLKDNKPLMAGKRFSTYFDQATRTSVLRINDVSKEDQGYYTCIVDNPLNSDQSTATLQVIPESKIDQRSYVETDAFKYLTPENRQRLTSNKDYGPGGVETESFVNPDAFRYLEAKKPSKQIDDNMAIDDRPIVDADAFRYLEARQASKVKKDTDVRASIDETPIVNPDAFRYLERKVDVSKLRRDQDIGPAVDETPQVDLTVFQFLERKGIPKAYQGPESSVDDSSSINADAFRYLERKPTRKTDDNGPLVDETPIVNPDAFRYLERKVVPHARDTTPAIDTTPIVNPEVFKYLERPNITHRVDEGPAIDTRPIVPQEAFRWLERPKPIQRKPEGPAVDESSYVNPLAFRYIEAKPKKIVDQGPSVDEKSYVNPQAFIYLEAPILKTTTAEGPAIDTSTYVNPQLFVQFDQKPTTKPKQEEPEINRPPRVIQPLRNTQVYEGKPIALVALVDGYPAPQLTWLKDGAELPASTRVTTNYDIPSKTAWIRIDSARPDDTAVYTLLAHNPAGNVRSDARLIVVPSIAPIDDTAFVPAEAFSRIERPTGTNRSNLPETTGVDDTSFINPELFRQFEVSLKQPDHYTDEVIVQVPARILSPLRSIQAPENVTVVLEAVVEGAPIPTFTWLKNQLPLSESNRFVTNYDLPSKRVTLTIKDVRESDTGIYTLLASNGPQLHNTSAKLQIIGAPSIDQSSFISIDAFKQLEQPLNQSRQEPVQPGVDQTSYVAQPDRFTVFDQIQPNRRPLNEFGGVDETPLINMEKIHLLEIPSKQPKQPYDIEEKSQAPSVLAPMRSTNAPEGTHVVLTAKIDGSPIPNFTWFKDNAPLVASSRFTTHYDILTKLIILQINDARPSDTGVYTVRADNPSGDVSTSANLNVSSLPSVRDQAFISTDKFDRLEQANQPRFIEDFSGVDERPLVDLTRLQQLEIKPHQTMPQEEHGDQYRPTILVPLRNVNAVENQPVVLAAQVQGKPQPQFVWFKNNQPLCEGNRFRTHYDIPSKTIFLTIAGARDDDTGVYRLLAKNPLGQDETSCIVNVDLNQPLIDQRSFVPQTAFEKLEKPVFRPNDVQSGVDQTSFFDQELFRPFDEHHIKHPSAIVGGEESDAVMPISAPKVVVPLRPATKAEGETVLLTTQVEGYPLPQFTWMLNNQPLMASNRVTSHYDMLTKRCFLQIFDSRPSDSGAYELVAENPAGQDRTRTELTVVPVSKIDQTGYVPYDKFSTLEFKPRIPSDLRSGVDATPFVSGEIFRLLEAKPINEQVVPDDEQNLPLEVIIPLKLAVAQEGQPVILTTKIRGRPVPQFTWLRNNQPLMESTRFQTHYDFPSETLVLEISDIWPHDAGTYTVIAQNPKTGERVETSAPLIVRTDTTPVDSTAFVAPDAFRTLESGPNLRTVFVEPGVDTNSFLSPDVLNALEQVKLKPTDVQDKDQPRSPPKVIIPLKPITCNEGQPINFTAKIEGNPHPTFTWYKNNQPLQESNRFWSHYDVPSKTVLLQINGARPDDSGTYTLVAKNPLGQDQTQTTVNVTFGPAVDTNAFVSPEKFAVFDQPYGPRTPLQAGVDTTPFVQPERFTQLELKAPPPTKEDLDQTEPPNVIVPLQSIQVNEGSPVLLQATITGKPTPNFVWLKDSAPLLASNRLRTRYDIATKQVLLQIHDVRPQDIGEYVVIATNPAGEDSSVCSLSVLPDKPGVDDRPFLPQDKFRDLEHPQGKGYRPLEIVPGVDTQPFVSPDKFRGLDHVPTSTQPEDVPIEAQSPPRVIVPLSNCELEELMPVILTTTIDAGVPMATFTWYKNGQPLLEGNRFTTKYDIYTKTLTLQVLAARPDDQGTYTVRAANPSGSDETTCKLAIRQTASIDTTPFVAAERFAPLEVKAPPPTKEDLDRMEPPSVIVPLQSSEVSEGTPVLLKATVVGKPTPTFIWLKDGAPLAASNRLRTRYDIATKQVLLQINDVRPQDIGEYVVIATNPAGEDSTVGSLSVVPDKPGVDDRPFVSEDKFRDLENPQGKGRRPLAIVPGVDTQPFVSLDKFRNLDHVPTSTRPEEIPIEAQRPPRVIVPLNNCELEELMPVILTATIDAGVPMATFTWYKNDQPLLEGNRFTTKYDIYTKTLTLQVLAARPDDQGTYTVVATNPCGSDETTCKLTIRPVASIDTTPFIQPERFAPLEVKAPLPTKEDLDQMHPPKVIVPLQSSQVSEGTSVLLKATVVGKPTPTFIWLKDGAPLAASNRLRTRYDIATKQVLLQINDVRPQDIGEYIVIATNPAGEDSTIGSLSVVPDKPGVDDRPFLPQDKFRNLENPQGKGHRPLAIVPGVDIQPFVSPDKFRNLDHVPTSTRPEEVPIEAQRPPRVIVPLSNCEVEELMPVILTTTIDAGVPMATFTWYKNGQPLLEGNRFTTKYDIYTKTLTLQVLAARPDDQGTYTVVATNPAGSDETTCKLTIRPVASIDTSPFIQPDRFAPLEVKAPPPTKEDLDQMEAPKVIVPLPNLEVSEGTPVLLKATVVGKPTPTFIWLKDGAPLAASNRLRTRYDIATKQVLLQINDVRPQDIGEYVVIATNPAGEDSTVGSLSVVPDKPGVDDRPFLPQDKFRDLENPQGKGIRPLAIVPGVDTQPFVSPDKFRNLDHVPTSTRPEEVPIEAQRPPRVIVPLSNCELEELMPVILTTTIDAGVPMATFTWYKNGQPLFEGNRFTTKYDIYTKTLTLQVLAARPDDQGTYTVVATNPAGSDETTCKLTIRTVASIDTTPFIQPDRFAPLEVKAPPPTKEDLDQMEPPKVIIPLPNLEVSEGTPVLLKATVVGKPTPTFIWLKDGAPLAASNRLRTRYDIATKQVLLQINDVRPQDIGEYVVIATNPAGEDSTVGSLSVVPDKPGVDDRPFLPQDKFRDLENPQGKGIRPLAIVPGVDTQPFVSPDKFRNLDHVPTSTRPEEVPIEAQRPPRVIVPLSNCELEELMPVILTTTIDAGVPMATFTWYKNDEPLLEGNRFTTNYDIVNRTITLQILASRPDDQGKYTVCATNPVGSDETTCELTIRPVSSIDTRPFVDAERFRPLEHRPGTAQNVDDENQLLRPPKVLVTMNNVRLTESQPIMLKSIIDAGYPMGKFTWLKDNRPLVESNRYRANFDINTRTASLFIDAARPTTDTGRYTVHVENIVGKDQTSGQVHVEGTPGIDDRPFVEPSKFGKFEGPPRSPGTSPRGPILQPDDSMKNRENLTPWIRLVKELEDQVIDETKAAQLFCSVDAHPLATITWLKDGRPLMVSQRFIPEYEFKTGIVRLSIYPVYTADSGEYTMVARNLAGEVSTKCKLRIHPTANVEEHPLSKFAGLRKIPQQPSGLASEPSLKPADLTDGQPPYFIKIPVDQEVPEGQLVRLYYIPAGRPEPSLTWYRNGQPLRPDDADHCDVINEGGVHSLLIRNPKLGPPVEYRCVAKNKYGEASFTVNLKVVERGSNIAPYFIEQLYDIIIIEGQDARLDASAQGFPEPQVSWEKEGRPLTPNKEYKVEFEGAKTTLYIREAKMTDAGWYQCTATSPAGTAITKCKVTVIPLSEAGKYAKELPQFGPQSLNKLPVLPEEDVRSKYMTVPVKPPEMKPEDLYKLPRRPKKIDNPAEEARKRGLKVLPDEVLAALQKNLEEYPEEEMYSKDRPQPPKFKVHLKSQLNLNEDDPCIFEAKLIPVRDPMMRVQWFKNGKILHHASRMIPRYDFADVSLEFLWTMAADDGIYECVATNPYGEDRTRAELKCRPKRSIIYNTQLPEGMEGVSKLQMLEDEIRYTSSMIGLEEKVEEKEPKAPEFIMPLEDITVDEGDNAKFIAKVDGFPRPRVTWTINYADIANGSRYKLVFDGLVHYLDIPRTRQYDAGTVICTAKNSLGQAESVATLNLRFRQDYRSVLSKTPGGIETGLDDSFDVDLEERLRLRTQNRQKESIDERARRPSTDKSLHPLHSKAADRMAWRQTVEKAGDAPNFTKPLLPLKSKEGSKVVVNVEFTGDPAPTVSWYRDGFMVEDSEDFKINTTATQSTLTIKHAFIIDSGLYTVKLFNPIGIRQCQAAIRIVPIIAEDQTPRFLDVPIDTEILAGDPVRFQCRVEGQPFPTVSFYREDEPVNLNDKRFRSMQEGDVFTLLLFEALPADSGQYEAVAENSVGKANTRFTLTVTPRGPDGKKASLIDDPKLIHKVPYLEKPLEDLHVKEGQSATFECIIPASFGSDVKWYKGTSEWAIKPSKFFKPKSDGTKHQLFILEAYAEDAGLYKCVVSNPVGTTATTATLKVDHTMQVPEFVRGFSNLTTYEGEQVRFEVEVRGDPAPTISWYRGGELIRDSPDFQIFTEGNRSLFYISEVFMEDQGLFTCTASNAAGSSDCSARLIVEPRPQL